MTKYTQISTVIMISFETRKSHRRIIKRHFNEDTSIFRNGDIYVM